MKTAEIKQAEQEQQAEQQAQQQAPQKYLHVPFLANYTERTTFIHLGVHLKFELNPKGNFGSCSPCLYSKIKTKCCPQSDSHPSAKELFNVNPSIIPKHYKSFFEYFEFRESTNPLQSTPSVCIHFSCRIRSWNNTDYIFKIVDIGIQGIQGITHNANQNY